MFALGQVTFPNNAPVLVNALHWEISVKTIRKYKELKSACYGKLHHFLRPLNKGNVFWYLWAILQLFLCTNFDTTHP